MAIKYLLNKKKSLITSFLIFGISIGLMAQERPFQIEGRIVGKSIGTVYLCYKDDLTGKSVIDSGIVVDGQFQLNGKVDGVIEAYFCLEKNPKSLTRIFHTLISPGKLKLAFNTAEISKSQFSGSEVQAQADELNQSRAELYAQIINVNEYYNRVNSAYTIASKNGTDALAIKKIKDSATMLKERSGELAGKLKLIDRSFMDKYPNSFVTASVLKGSIRQMDYHQAQKRYADLSTKIKNSPMGKGIKISLDQLGAGSPGAIAYNFTSSELNGDKIALESFKGKYVLLDFWASWCIPCRQGNPHLLNLYAKYRPKGFEIIGIADNDSSEDAWRKAVNADKIGVWKHILRGYGSKPATPKIDLSEKFGVVALPTKILVNPEGKIIGRFVGGGQGDPKLDKKLKEIFGT